MLRAGFAAGFFSGLLGVGGGFILVPALHKLTPLPVRSITATSLMVLAVVSAGGLLQWLASSGVAAAVGVPFGAGALAGMALARGMSSRISEGRLRRIFAGLCLLGSLGLLAKLVGGP
jgi:uncharacterized membrane protein YfcA